MTLYCNICKSNCRKTDEDEIPYCSKCAKKDGISLRWMHGPSKFDTYKIDVDNETKLFNEFVKVRSNN